jgi:hypothetical protein
MSCNDKVPTDIAAIESALNEWSRANGGRYPATLDPLITPDENGETSTLSPKRRPSDVRAYGCDPEAHDAGLAQDSLWPFVTCGARGVLPSFQFGSTHHQ